MLAGVSRHPAKMQVMPSAVEHHLANVDFLPCSDVTYMIHNNELGGMLAPGVTPLAPSSASFENFQPTGAEGAPNSAMFVPYQADYYFLSTDTAPANYPSYRASTGSSNSSATASSG